MSLRYANGRIHEGTLISENELRPGDEFELHGRRWRAIGPIPGRREGTEAQRILCTLTDGAARPPSTR